MENPLLFHNKLIPPVGGKHVTVSFLLPDNKSFDPFS